MKIFRFITIPLLLVFAACTSQKEKEMEAAKSLLHEIAVQVDNQQNESALLLIDSLHKSFPLIVSIRKEADVLQDTVEWRIAKRNLQQFDSLFQQNKQKMESLAGLFRFERNAKYQGKGIYTHKKLGTKEGNYFSAYTDEEGLLFLTISYSGKKINFNTVELLASGVNIQVPSGSDGNFHTFDTRGEHFENLIISGESAKRAFVFISTNKDLKIKLSGSKGSSGFGISETIRKAISQTGEYAQLISEDIKLKKEIKRLKNKIFTIEAKK